MADMNTQKDEMWKPDSACKNAAIKYELTLRELRSILVNLSKSSPTTYVTEKAYETGSAISCLRVGCSHIDVQPGTGSAG
jgi:hypothetical protein